MEKVIEQAINETLYFTGKFVRGLLILLCFWVAALILQNFIRRVGEKSTLYKYKDILNLVGRIVKGTLIVFGVVTALGTVGVNVSALIAGLGLTGFALGFAFRDILSNLLAGILILIYRPFHIGDYISVSGFEGLVIEIDLRYTMLQADDKKILIPNSVLFTNAITLLNIKR